MGTLSGGLWREVTSGESHTNTGHMGRGWPLVKDHLNTGHMGGNFNCLLVKYGLHSVYVCPMLTTPGLHWALSSSVIYTPVMAMLLFKLDL